MVKLLPKIHDWTSDLDRISTFIKAAEEHLRKHACVAAAEHGPLHWRRREENSTFSIHVDDKPLLEARVERKIECVSLVAGLCESANRAMEELLSDSALIEQLEKAAPPIADPPPQKKRVVVRKGVPRVLIAPVPPPMITEFGA